MDDYGNGAAAGAGLLIGIIAFVAYFVLILAIYAVFGWMLSRIFRKAGIDQWKAWVPVYNTWVLLEMGGQLGWISLGVFIPGLNIVSAVFVCIAIYNLDAGFGKPGAGWLLLYIFLPLIWLIILAFDGSTWDPRRMAVPPLYGQNVPWPYGDTGTGWPVG